MKCVMRVIITARQSLTPVYEAILGKLIGILGIMSKNPSNPNFAQYTFEGISALIRFIVGGKPDVLPNFETSLFGPWMYILQQDVEGMSGSNVLERTLINLQNMCLTSSKFSLSYSNSDLLGSRYQTHTRHFFLFLQHQRYGNKRAPYPD